MKSLANLILSYLSMYHISILYSITNIFPISLSSSGGHSTSTINDHPPDIDLCNGQNVYINNNLFYKIDTNIANKYPIYKNNDDILFYSNEMWLLQTSDNNPSSAEHLISCKPNESLTCSSLKEDIKKLENELNTCKSTINCSDNLRLPIAIFNEGDKSSDWWFCDELLKSDCKYDGVPEHCPRLCDKCDKFHDKVVCNEKYHTKVFVEGIGSIYCDQLYQEECDISGVKDICCSTCINSF